MLEADEEDENEKEEEKEKVEENESVHSMADPEELTESQFKVAKAVALEQSKKYVHSRFKSQESGSFIVANVSDESEKSDSDQFMMSQKRSTISAKQASRHHSDVISDHATDKLRRVPTENINDDDANTSGNNPGVGEPQEDGSEEEEVMEKEATINDVTAGKPLSANSNNSPAQSGGGTPVPSGATAANRTGSAGSGPSRSATPVRGGGSKSITAARSVSKAEAGGSLSRPLPLLTLTPGSRAGVNAIDGSRIILPGTDFKPNEHMDGKNTYSFNLK